MGGAYPLLVASSWLYPPPDEGVPLGSRGIHSGEAPLESRIAAKGMDSLTGLRGLPSLGGKYSLGEARRG